MIYDQLYHKSILQIYKLIQYVLKKVHQGWIYNNKNILRDITNMSTYLSIMVAKNDQTPAA